MPRRNDPTPAPSEDPPALDDPRVHDAYVRRFGPDGDRAETVLVGVAHDHPASVHRVSALAAATDPDVLALEMPPLSLPLLRVYAAEGGDPPDRGGEMSAAVRAAPNARAVGIDGIDARFLWTLAGTLRATDADAGTVADVAGRTGRVARRTAACWLRGAFGTAGPDPLEPTTYDCADDPAEQAAHERAHVGRCRSLLDAVGSSPSNSAVDAAREACMARRIAALRTDGRVLAVVGWAHLDPLAERLRRAD